MASISLPTAILGSAGLGLTGSLISSSQQQAAASKAASNLNPFKGPGIYAADALRTLLGLAPPNPKLPGSTTTFQGSPGYQWQLQQGIDAIDNSAAARGGIVSGNTLKALQTYGTGLANQDFYNFLDHIYGLAGLGENAAAGVGNFATQGGNAAAAGTVAATNAAGNALTNLSMLPFLSYLNNLGTGGGYPSAGEVTALGQAYNLYP